MLDRFLQRCDASPSNAAAWWPHRHPIVSARGRRNARDAGVVLIVVIVCLVIAAAILASFATVSVIGRDSIRAEAWQLQAKWLAESAIERAAAQLAADRAYDGESWTVSAEELAAQEGGVVSICIQAFPDDPNRRLVSVQADYPDDPVHRCSCRKSVMIELPEPPKESPAEEPSTEAPNAPASDAVMPPEKPAETPAEKPAEPPAPEAKPDPETNQPSQGEE